MDARPGGGGPRARGTGRRGSAPGSCSGSAPATRRWSSPSRSALRPPVRQDGRVPGRARRGRACPSRRRRGCWPRSARGCWRCRGRGRAPRTRTWCRPSIRPPPARPLGRASCSPRSRPRCSTPIRARGRERARAFVNDYLALPNYVRNLRRLGFTDDDLRGSGQRPARGRAGRPRRRGRDRGPGPRAPRRGRRPRVPLRGRQRAGGAVDDVPLRAGDAWPPA